jgi:hypothetical protein
MRFAGCRWTLFIKAEGRLFCGFCLVRLLRELVSHR